MKNKTITAFLIIQILSTGCGFLSPGTDTPLKPAGTAGGESLTVSWEAVTDAVRYSLYFTDDNTDPTIATQSVITGLTDTVYLHEGLDPAKTYKYAVAAINTSGRQSSLSPVSDPLKPNPVLTLNVIFPDYYNQSTGMYIMDVPYNPNLNEVIGSTVLVETLTGTTDSSGSVTFHCTLDHEKYWGYTVFKDTDSNGLLSPNDMVWGSGSSGSYEYIYFSDFVSSSINLSIDNWDTKSAEGVHVY